MCTTECTNSSNFNIRRDRVVVAEPLLPRHHTTHCCLCAPIALFFPTEAPAATLVHWKHVQLKGSANTGRQQQRSSATARQRSSRVKSSNSKNSNKKPNSTSSNSSSNTVHNSNSSNSSSKDESSTGKQEQEDEEDEGSSGWRARAFAEEEKQQL